jgi:hypothetical protein
MPTVNFMRKRLELLAQGDALQAIASVKSTETLAATGSFHQRTVARPIVLADQGGHWLITHDTAVTELDAVWHTAHRSRPVPVPVIP